LTGLGQKTQHTVIPRKKSTHQTEHPTRDQLDTSALKYALNECSIFDGWYDSKSKNGWLGMFFQIGQLRNKIHHNAKQELDDQMCEEARSHVFGLFDQIDKKVTSIDAFCQSKKKLITRSKCEITKILGNKFQIKLEIKNFPIIMPPLPPAEF